MRLSDLQSKMVINVLDGRHLGVIMDAEISETGNIISFTIMNKHFFRRLFHNESEIILYFKQIVKIGEDVILVET